MDPGKMSTDNFIKTLEFGIYEKSSHPIHGGRCQNNIMLVQNERVPNSWIIADVYRRAACQAKNRFVSRISIAGTKTIVKKLVKNFNFKLTLNKNVLTYNQSCIFI